MTRWVLGFLLLIGLVVPGARVMAAETKEPEGKKLFIKYKCSSCHSIEAAGVVKKAEATESEEPATTKKPPDLSGVGLQQKADWIALFMQKKEKLEGELHPKKFRGTDKELGTIAAWLETMKTPPAKKDAKAAAPKPETNEKSEAKEESEGATKDAGDSGK